MDNVHPTFLCNNTHQSRLFLPLHVKMGDGSEGTCQLMGGLLDTRTTIKNTLDNAHPLFLCNNIHKRAGYSSHYTSKWAMETKERVGYETSGKLNINVG